MDLSSIENGVKNPLKFPKSVENQANDKVLNNCWNKIISHKICLKTNSEMAGKKTMRSVINCQWTLEL